MTPDDVPAYLKARYAEHGTDSAHYTYEEWCQIYPLTQASAQLADLARRGRANGVHLTPPIQTSGIPASPCPPDDWDLTEAAEEWRSKERKRVFTEAARRGL